MSLSQGTEISGWWMTGYDASEKDLFYADAQAAVDAIFSHEPFGSHREHFNFLAVAAESRDSGVSVPRNGTSSVTHSVLWRTNMIMTAMTTRIISPMSSLGSRISRQSVISLQSGRI